MTEARKCMAVWLGRLDYAKALDIQNSLHSRVASGELPHILLLLEHFHTYTLGRRGKDADVLISPDELAKLRVSVYHTDRGGEVTYHGPGQLVGYPIFDLRSWGGGPVKYVRRLEQMIISTLQGFDISAESEGHPTGVWVAAAKIAAIGVKVSRGVTTHGFALNVDPDLSYFDHIISCGIPNAKTTSVAAELPHHNSDTIVVANKVTENLNSVFGLDVFWATPQDLYLPNHTI